MTTWGADLGARTLHLFGIEDEPDSYIVAAIEAVFAKGRVSDHAPWVRGRELQAISDFAASMIVPGDRVVIEEPPKVRNLRVFLKLSQTSAAAAIGHGAEVFFVPVDSWKKGTVGRGGVGKDVVAAWLETNHPDLSRECGGNQNFVDAACLALYGRQL